MKVAEKSAEVGACGQEWRLQGPEGTPEGWGFEKVAFDVFRLVQLVSQGEGHPVLRNSRAGRLGLRRPGLSHL